MSTAEETGNAFTKLIVSAVILAVGVTIVSQVVGVGGLVSLDGSIRVGGDGVVALQQDKGVTEVRDSTGRAASLSGGEVVINGGLGVRDDPDDQWAFGTYASVENSSRASVVWSLGEEWILAYQPDYGGEFVVWHYNRSSTHSYATSVAAASPGSLSAVLLERDGDTITLTNSSGATSSIVLTPGTDSSAPVPTTNNLNGRLEETRSWDRTLTSAEAQTYRSDGIEPVAVGNRSARLLFDQSGTDVAVEFRTASGELRGSASRGTGLAGTVMTQGTDFSVIEFGGGLAVKPLAGGELENQPRIALSTPQSAFEQAALAIGSVFALAGVVLIVVVARRILAVVRAT